MLDLRRGERRADAVQQSEARSNQQETRQDKEVLLVERADVVPVALDVESVRPGDLAWYEGNYELARLHRAMGKEKEACDLLEQMKPTMPGLSDADLRKKLDDLYQHTCR
jgi:hypothetical protein